MSVINQMLKDLDKRQSEQKRSAEAVVPVPAKSSTSRVMFIIVAIIVLNVLGIFSWQLYSENQQLKEQVQANVFAISANNDGAVSDVVLTDASEKIDDKQSAHQVPIVAVEAASEKATIITSPVKQAASDIADELSKQSLVSAEKLANSNNDSVKINPLATSLSDNTEKMPALDAANVENTSDITGRKQVANVAKATPSLTISRTQLTPQALAANKITQAEQAIERNDILKAEALFEEVLLIMPEHVTARKQLAALWYGRKSYQDAVNLLSQGIALAPQSEEMRLMTARIYYEQGQPRPAYNVLRPVNHSTNTELQALLANTAADLSEHGNAIVAYEKLIALEPHVGRWWLGSAVSLDSLGKFVLARDAYKQAIARNDLSNSAMQFARQRLIELGE